jgi:hypothetical protein
MHFHLAASHDQSKSKHTLPLKESAQTTFKIIAKSTRNHHIPWLKALFPDVLSVGKELNDAEWFSMMLNNYHVVGKLSIHLTYFVSPISSGIDQKSQPPKLLRSAEGVAPRYRSLPASVAVPMSPGFQRCHWDPELTLLPQKDGVGVCRCL